MKLLALYLTHLKGFARNWKSVALLLALPLVLISALFLSFNPDGLQKVSIGYVYDENVTLDASVIENAFSGFARLQKYSSFEICKRNLAAYKEYACIVAKGSSPVVLTIHYDNTREPVIWEILERTKQTISVIERSQSTDVASDFLSKFQRAEERLTVYDAELVRTDTTLSQVITQLESRSRELVSERQSLDTTMSNLAQDISDGRRELSSARQDIISARDRTLSATYQAQNAVALIPSTNETSYVRSLAISEVQKVQQEASSLSSNALNSISRAESRLIEYEDARYRGEQTSIRLASLTTELNVAITNLRAYRTTIQNTRTELAAIRADLGSLNSVDATTLVEPVKLEQEPTYIPIVSLEEIPEELQSGDGVSFILLQTMFPSMLVLVLLFLSLLIGAFVCLQQINSTAYVRIRLAKSTFLLDTIAIFFSAVTIVTLPALVVMALGAIIFKLPILASFSTLFVLVALFISTFVLTGMLLAYLFKSESISLMVSTFVLVFIVFLTGILLPIERMHPIVSTISHLSSSTIFLETFKQVVFYGAQGHWNDIIIDVPIIILSIQVMLISIIVLGVKAVRDKY